MLDQIYSFITKCKKRMAEFTRPYDLIEDGKKATDLRDQSQQAFDEGRMRDAWALNMEAEKEAFKYQIDPFATEKRENIINAYAPALQPETWKEAIASLTPGARSKS